MYSRNEVVQLVNSWIGKNEADGSYKSIIDIYNSYSGPFPRNVKMQYGWSWCACTWSALAIKLGYTAIMPIEISCGELVKKAKAMGIWQENDAYVPKPGDAILYDWDDNGRGDDTGWPDHIGTVTYVNTGSGYFVVTEGNYNRRVQKRTVSFNSRYIRGFITPRYDSDVTIAENSSGKSIDTIAREVIAGVWGSGNERKTRLAAAGYNYNEVQSRVNSILNGSAVAPSQPSQNQNQPVGKKVTATCAARKYNASYSGTYRTTANLYLRDDAGTNKKALCLIPKGTKIQTYGYYNVDGVGKPWLYLVVVLDGVQYTGFSHIDYLERT